MNALREEKRRGSRNGEGAIENVFKAVPHLMMHKVQKAGVYHTPLSVCLLGMHQGSNSALGHNSTAVQIRLALPVPSQCVIFVHCHYHVRRQNACHDLDYRKGHYLWDPQGLPSGSFVDIAFRLLSHSATCGSTLVAHCEQSLWRVVQPLQHATLV